MKYSWDQPFHYVGESSRTENCFHCKNSWLGRWPRT